VQALLGSENYREFLKRAFELEKARGPGFSYAAFARKAGISSRSFPRDVVLGQKRLTLSSLPGFCRALGLKGEAKNLFHLLVSLEEPEVRSPSLSEEQVRDRILKLRSRMRSKQRFPHAEQAAPAFYRHEHWGEIYVSLGRVDRGETLAGVARRSGLPAKTCAEALERMVAEGLVARQGSGESARFVPQEQHLAFAKLVGDEYFKTTFMRTLSHARASADKAFRAEDRLFFQSVFSVSRARMPQFKQELRELLLKFVDHAEAPEGDGLAKLVLGLFPSE
jgi:uncharacterized protein (TIGR02147 family)